jgi:hypothetical protein
MVRDARHGRRKIRNTASALIPAASYNSPTHLLANEAQQRNPIVVRDLTT